LHHQLYYHRQSVVNAGLLDPTKERALNMAAWVFKHPRLLDFSGKIARKIVPLLPRWMLYNGVNAWGKYREMPEFPKKSFKELYQERQKGAK
jgi:L-lactate dehydrogenase complex protein LldF